MSLIPLCQTPGSHSAPTLSTWLPRPRTRSHLGVLHLILSACRAQGKQVPRHWLRRCPVSANQLPRCQKPGLWFLAVVWACRARWGPGSAASLGYKCKTPAWQGTSTGQGRQKRGGEACACVRACVAMSSTHKWAHAQAHMLAVIASLPPREHMLGGPACLCRHDEHECANLYAPWTQPK